MDIWTCPSGWRTWELGWARLADWGREQWIWTYEYVLKVDEHESEDGQDSRVEGENSEDWQTNMSFRLMDKRVRMDKTLGLSTVRIDQWTCPSGWRTWEWGWTRTYEHVLRLMDMRLRMDKTHGMRESTVRIDKWTCPSGWRTWEWGWTRLMGWGRERWGLT
jgi:hypothetical protein